MRLGDFLSQIGRTVSYYPKLAKITGGVEANVFLCQMYYWKGKESDPDGWIYKTQQEIEEETGISFDSQKTVRSRLVKRGLLKERFKGMPRRLEFQLDPDALHERWDYFIKHGVEPEVESDRRKLNKPSQQCVDGKRHKSIKSDSLNRNNRFKDSEIENIDLNKSIKSDSLNRNNRNNESDLIDSNLYTSDDNTKLPHQITYIAPPKPGAPPTQESEREEEESLINEDLFDRLSQEMSQLQETHLTVNKNQDSEHPAISSSGSQVSAAAIAPLVNSKHTSSNESPQAITAHTNSDEVKILNKNIGSSERCDRQFEPLPPWRVNKKRNAYLPEFLEYLQKEHLPFTSYYSGRKVTRGNACEWISAREYDEQKLSQLESRWSDFEEWQEQKSRPKPIAIPLETSLPQDPVAEVSEEEKERSRQMVLERIAAAKQKAQSSKKSPAAKIDYEKQERLAAVEAMFNSGV